MGTMHKANVNTSERLRRVVNFLTFKGSAGATTWEIQQEARVCSASTVMSELSQNGVEYVRKETVVGHQRINRYWLAKFAPAASLFALLLLLVPWSLFV